MIDLLKVFIPIQYSSALPRFWIYWRENRLDPNLSFIAKYLIREWGFKAKNWQKSGKNLFALSRPMGIGHLSNLKKMLHSALFNIFLFYFTHLQSFYFTLGALTSDYDQHNYFWHLASSFPLESVWLLCQHSGALRI